MPQLTFDLLFDQIVLFILIYIVSAEVIKNFILPTLICSILLFENICFRTLRLFFLYKPEYLSNQQYSNRVELNIQKNQQLSNALSK